VSRILITGASGLVGAHLFARLERAGHIVTGSFCENGGRVPVMDPRSSLMALDLSEPSSIEQAFRLARPETVIHAAALSDLGYCEQHPDEAQRVNVDATVELAALCRRAGARFIHCSSDQVFDGERGGYSEGDPARPLHVYGRTKREAEQRVAEACPGATALRLALVLGASPSGTRSASEQIVGALRDGRRVRLFTDEFRTPVLVDEVARTIQALLARDGPDVLHVAGPERISRFALGQLIARTAGLDAGCIEPARRADAPRSPERPRDLSLSTERLRSLGFPPHPALEAALRDTAAGS